MATIKWISCKTACCHDCTFEVTGRFAERDARRHAEETGHIPTLEVTYDIAATPKETDHA